MLLIYCRILWVIRPKTKLLDNSKRSTEHKMENAGNPAGKAIGWNIFFRPPHWLPTNYGLGPHSRYRMVRVDGKNKYFVFLWNPNYYDPAKKNVSAQKIHKVPELIVWKYVGNKRLHY